MAKLGKKCSSLTELQDLFDNLFFTLYTVIGNVQLRNEQKPYANPVFFIDTIYE